jgi:hypothetical protein
MKKDADFQIRAFLDENSNLFVIMGVFGALSIYLNNILATIEPQSSSPVNAMLQIGIVSSLFLFILVSLIIVYNALKTHGEQVPISFFRPNIGNLVRILFLVPFLLLILAVSYFVFTSFPLYSNFVTGYALSWIAIMVFFAILTLTKQRSFLVVFVILLFLVAISVLGQLYATNYEFYPGIFFCNSLASGSLIGVIILSIAFVFKKIKMKKV